MVNGGLIALGLAAAAGGATGTLSTHAHGAPSALVLRVPTLLQCGRALGSVEVTFPASARVPAAIPAADVTVDGRPARTAKVAGRTVTVSAPRPTGMLCDSLAPGTMVVAFTRAAGLRNPARRGAYLLHVRRNGDTYAVRLTIS